MQCSVRGPKISPPRRPRRPGTRAARNLWGTGASPILAPTVSREHSRPSRNPRSIPMARFAGVDFFDVDSLLTEEERQIRDHVRAWVEDRYLPLVERAYEEAYFPAEVIPEI